MTKEEALEKNGFSFEWFKFDNEHSAKNLLAGIDEYASLKAEEASVEFAEWIRVNAEPYIHNKNLWTIYGKQGVIIKDKLSSLELYQTFKNQKP